MDLEKKDYFEFDAKAGGYFPFTGVMDNNKEIQEINVDRDNNTASIKYTDGYVFTVSATIVKTGNNFKITNIQKSWTKPNNGV